MSDQETAPAEEETPLESEPETPDGDDQEASELPEEGDDSE